MSSFLGWVAVVFVDPYRQEIVFVLWAFAHVYIFLRKRSPTSVWPASAARDRQSQSNLFRPDLFCLSVNILDLESIQLTLARTCAVIVNVPDLKAYSSYAARNSDRVNTDCIRIHYCGLQVTRYL